MYLESIASRIKEALAPRTEREELKELITGIVRDESEKCLISALRQQNMMLQEELNRLHCERIASSNGFILVSLPQGSMAASLAQLQGVLIW